MDRTQDFQKYANVIPGEINISKPFYVALYDQIEEFKAKIEKISSYKKVLQMEEETLQLQNNVNKVLNIINVTGSKDLITHYQGIKLIINKSLIGVNRKIQDKKNNLSGYDSELFCEKAVVGNKNNNFKNYSNQLMEMENKQIVHNTTYEKTKQQLKKIEEVQLAINENLILQDERIDCICEATGKTTDIYKNLNCDDFIDGGSFFRRFLFIILVCLSIVLLFLHFFYKK